MNISSIEASLFKVLYESFEVPSNIKIFESVFYVDFKSYDRWIVIDTLSHDTGPLPSAFFFLHISTKQGLQNEKVVLNRMIDQVTEVFNPGARFDVYDSETAALIGEMEVSETNLAPVFQHAGGGSYRSLTVGLVYAGDTP